MLQIRSFDAKGRTMPVKSIHGAPMDALDMILSVKQGDCIITAPIDLRRSIGEFHDATRNGGGGNFSRFAAVMEACGISVIPMRESFDRAIVTIPADMIARARKCDNGPDRAILRGMLLLATWVNDGGARLTQFEDEHGKHTMRALAARYELKEQNTEEISARALKDGMIAVEVADPMGLVPIALGGKARCLSQALETMLRWCVCSLGGNRAIKIGDYVNDAEMGIPLLTCFGRFAAQIGHVPSNRRNTVDHFLG